MTNDIKRGDRVRATNRTNGDFSEFTVTDVARDGSLESSEHHFDILAFTFTRIEHPRPTVPGLYSFTTGGGRQLMLTKLGEFFLVDFTAPGEHSCIPLKKFYDESEFFSKYRFTLNYKYEDYPSERPVVKVDES